MIGTTVGKYRIVDRLGRGGMGIVYKAVDETLDREVAIKVLNPDLADADVLKRFRAEAVTLARLNHRSIATLYELHRQDDDLLMVMELVRGETFHELAERLGPLAPPQAVHLCAQVLDGLAHAHRAGVVHRDLKPANLMISDEGSVKIMDFGIARMLGTEHHTRGGYMMGTPAYMAPEQVLDREVDGRADLYAVGVVLYRLLAGRLPFEADTAVAMVQKQISDPPTPLAVFCTDVSESLSTILERALAKDPSDRFQTADEFRAALVDAEQPQPLGEMPTIGTPTPPGLRRDADLTVASDTRRPVTKQPAVAGSARPATPAAAIPPAVERTTGTTVVLGRPHLMGLAALIVVLVAGIVVFAIAALRRNDVPPQTAPSLLPPSSPLVAEPSPNRSAPPPPAPLVPPPSQSLPTPPPSARPAQTAATGTAGPKSPALPPSTDARSAKVEAANAVPAPPVKAGGPPPPVSFAGIRVLVPDGADKSRERQGVLQLGGGRLIIAERAGGAAVVDLPYKSITGAFYSRSKQPKWRDGEGKTVEGKVELGKMGFFRGDRNWLVLLSASEPLILRVEDKDLNTVLPAIEEQTGIPIRR
jgi:serine/threonine-protein kinase